MYSILWMKNYFVPSSFKHLNGGRTRECKRGNNETKRLVLIAMHA